MRNIKLKLFEWESEFNLCILLLVAFFIISISILFLSYDKKYSFYENCDVEKIKEVAVINSNGERQIVKLPKVINIDKEFNFFVDLSPYKDFSKKSLISSFAYSNVKIYADNKKIYEIKKSDNSIFKSGGYQVAIFDIPDNLNYSEIRVHVEPNFKNLKSYKISNIRIGRKSDIISCMIFKESITMLVVLLLLINFITTTLLVFLRKDFFRSENYSIFYLSVFGLMVAIYFLTQMWSTSYFWAGAKEFIYSVEFITLMVILLPTCFYIKYKLDPKFKKMIDIMAFAFFLNFFFQVILALFGIKEFKEMVYLTHIIIVSYLLSVLFAVIFTDSSKYPDSKSVVVPVIVIIVSTIASLIYYFIYKITIFQNVGLLVVISLIVLEIKELHHKYRYYEKERIEKNFYKKLSITDNLTGLLNRQAHEDFIKEIEYNKISGWILSIDINNLKYINDNFGHIVGDKLIVDFANILKRLYDRNEKINSFRIGGDEFFVFIDENDKFDIKSLVDEIKIEYSNCSGYENGFIPTFSVGYHYYDSYKSDDVMFIYNIADKLMYEDKVRHKPKFNFENTFNSKMK